MASPPDRSGENPAAATLSPWAREIAKLTKAGIGDDVVLWFINGTPGTFNLTAEQVIYFTDLGASDAVITTMLQHDFEVVAGLRSLPASTVPLTDPFFPITTAPGRETRTTPPVVSPKAQPAPAGGSNGGQTAGAAALVEREAEPAAWPPEIGVTGSELAFVAPESTPKIGAYPVREPRPVQITEPIIVFRAAWPRPNMLIVRGP